MKNNGARDTGGKIRGIEGDFRIQHSVKQIVGSAGVEMEQSDLIGSAFLVKDAPWCAADVEGSRINDSVIQIVDARSDVTDLHLRASDP